jgi:hypothetical protein
MSGSALGIFSAASGLSVEGGTLFSDATYFYRKFTASGDLTVNGTVLMDILMIAGGGGGGDDLGGAGGAGGVLGFASQSITGTKTLTVGAGGASVTTNGSPGNNGVDSTFTGLTTCVGGGGGGGYLGPISGKSGGSGGGATFTPPGNSGGAGTSGQGNAGGAGGNSTGGSGGGAAGVGPNGTNNGIKPLGGDATATDNVTNLGSIVSWLTATSSGVSSKIAGGGSSAGDTGPGAVQGGGGLGAAIFGSPYPNASPATANTGGGGGGSGQGSSGGGAGGSGLVIVRYLRTAV